MYPHDQRSHMRKPFLLNRMANGRGILRWILARLPGIQAFHNMTDNFSLKGLLGLSDVVRYNRSKGII